MATTTTNQAAPKAVVKYENLADHVLAKIDQYQADGGLHLPQNYSVENHLKSAWLILQSTKDRAGHAALEVCTKDSIANSLLDMVLQGLAVSKNQGYFIVYGNQLQFQRSYFGGIALAKRSGGLAKDPVANVIYEGDDFVYNIDVETGLTTLVRHGQKLENIDDSKIKGAYAICTMADGSRQVTIMTMPQIRTAWEQGPTKGQSPAHKKFTGEMCKKTVINRACKVIINASDDAWLYEGKGDEMDADSAVAQREAVINQAQQPLLEEDVDFEEIPVAQQPAQPEKVEKPVEKAVPQQQADPDDEPGY